MTGCVMKTSVVMYERISFTVSCHGNQWRPAEFDGCEKKANNNECTLHVKNNGSPNKVARVLM